MSIEESSEASPVPGADKATLSHDELTDVIELCLWAGQMLLQYGANSFRVEESIHRFGTGLGCDWLDVIVRTESLTVTASSGGDFRNKSRRVVRLGVNMKRLAAVSDLGRLARTRQLDRTAVRAELERIDVVVDHYNRWLTIFMVGLACAAFSQLFGADWAASLITFLAAASAMFLHQEMTKRYFNPFITITVCAWAAGLIASLAALPGVSQTPVMALNASVLLLVPGVPLINSAHDFLRGYMSNGITRGVLGLIISLCIALGLIVAILLTGVGL